MNDELRQSPWSSAFLSSVQNGLSSQAVTDVRHWLQTGWLRRAVSKTQSFSDCIQLEPLLVGCTRGSFSSLSATCFARGDLIPALPKDSLENVD